MNRSVEDAVDRIKEEFPEASRDVIREELKRNRNNVDQTKATLQALVDVAKLRKEFPKMSADVVAHVFKKNDNDRDMAAVELAQLVLDYHRQKLEKRKQEGGKLNKNATMKAGATRGASNDGTYGGSVSPRGNPPLKTSSYDEDRNYRNNDEADNNAKPPMQPGMIRRADTASALNKSTNQAPIQRQTPPPVASRAAAAPAARIAATMPAFTQPQPQRSPPVVHTSPPVAQEPVTYDELPPAPMGGGADSVRALYDYQTNQPTKLNFNKGDIITLTDSTGDAWWYGTLNGQTGKFPKTYVRPVADEILAVALYDFGEKDGHLKFKKDDEIVLLNKRKGSQWWEGTLVQGSPVGIFPINYVSVTKNDDLFQRLQAEE